MKWVKQQIAHRIAAPLLLAFLALLCVLCPQAVKDGFKRAGMNPEQESQK